jgi:hypothetical protein
LTQKIGVDVLRHCSGCRLLCQQATRVGSIVQNVGELRTLSAS